MGVIELTKVFGVKTIKYFGRAQGTSKNLSLYMGQKDQDGYYAEKCHFFKQRNLYTPI